MLKTQRMSLREWTGPRTFFEPENPIFKIGRIHGDRANPDSRNATVR
jgi:hypothetical protein